MIRVSDYNIYVPVDNSSKEYLLLHGYSGALDVVSEDIYNTIKDCAQSPDNFSKFSEDELNTLMERGYVTRKSSDEEVELFKKAAQVLTKRSKVTDYYITIIPTYNCNFRCPYCFEKGNYKTGNNLLERIMDKQMADNLFRALDEEKEKGRTVSDEIVFFGGEPLMKENLEVVRHIVEQGSKRGYYFFAVTNGYDLEYYKDLLAKDKIRRIQITIDGTEKLHDKRRFLYNGQKTFNKIIQNIDSVIDKDIQIHLRSNIDKINLKDVEQLVGFYKEKGWIEKPGFSYYFKSVHACYEKEEKRIYDDEVMKTIDFVHNSKNLFDLNATYSLISRALSPVFENGNIAISKPFFCGATSNMVTVDPFGDLYPCWEVIGDKNCSIGDLSAMGFNFNDNADYWRNRNVMNMDTCSRCAYGLICAGNCPTHSMVYEGDIYKPSCEKFVDIFNQILVAMYNSHKEKTQAVSK